VYAEGVETDAQFNFCVLMLRGRRKDFSYEPLPEMTSRRWVAHETSFAGVQRQPDFWSLGGLVRGVNLHPSASEGLLLRDKQVLA